MEIIKMEKKSLVGLGFLLVINSITEEEEMASHKYKPRSTSFTLYKKGSSIISKDYMAPIPPVKPQSNDANEIKAYKDTKEQYVNSLNVPVFQNKFPKYMEDIQPHMLMVCEEYDHVLAAAVNDLKDEILDFIDSSQNEFQPGVIRAEVQVYDGSDGFGGLKLLTQRSKRENPDHGITVDFTIHEIKKKPNKEPTKSKISKDISRSVRGIKLLHSTLGADDPGSMVQPPLCERAAKIKAPLLQGEIYIILYV